MNKLQISENGRYFINPDGSPFSFLADTDWTMPQRIAWHDAVYFMQKRKSQGFTVLQIVALDPEADPEICSPAGEKALIGGDLDHPNERYFAYLDKLLTLAEEYGFYVLLLPVWGQLVVGEDWSGHTYEKTVTVDNAYRYGAYIGHRYRDRKNILWCLGGDRMPIHKGRDYRPVWRQLAEGIAKGVTGRELRYNVPDRAWQDVLMTYHACHEAKTGLCSTMSYWTEEDVWIRFIMLQSGHGTEPRNYELVAADYARTPVRPVWDGEPAYERMPTAWPDCREFHDTWMVRRRAYWSLLSGAFGFTYGHASVWCSVSEKERDSLRQLTWYEALQSEGSCQMKILRDFMEDIGIAAFRPCREILPVKNADADLTKHIEAAVSADGKTLCVYFPGGGKTRLKAAGEIRPSAFPYLWWFSPRDGKFYDAEGRETAEAKTAVLSLEAPTEGRAQDWVAILKAEKSGPPVSSHTYGEAPAAAEAGKVFNWG
ncbi:MAG: glycoside hydrolase family 140 protein [Lachnospiraceae bacterium]|jgi:hypothetical protein|nr:glycoside hydrolase family 140 protein [Lachnospiraceae bacterium]